MQAKTRGSSWCVRRASILCGALLTLLTASGCAFDQPQSGSGGQAGSGPEVAALAQALGNKPHTSCTSAVHDGHGYWFCPTNASWSAAKSACEAAGVDTKLVSIDDAAENAFVKSHVGLDSRIGASDQSTEGAWLWDNGSVQFWSGTSFGSAVGGNYANWATGQPNNGGLGTEDCALLSAITGHWSDVSCTTGYWYVCEEDLCSSDPIKEAPGQCGCGTADTDSDGDGTADCHDECPNDASRTELPCTPEPGCTLASFGGSNYFFCSSIHTHPQAKTLCESVGMALARIDTSAENTWIDLHIANDRWIGGTDQASEGAWTWGPGGTQFWQGNFNGSAVGGAYTNWALGQPNDFGNQDCLTIFGDGKWDDEGCSEHEQYICEDACPDDDQKTEPGVCGCGVSDDADADGDSVPDCLDACPFDGAKTEPGQCGCMIEDVDRDDDGTADCVDACPDDAEKTTLGITGCGHSDEDTDGDGVPDALDDAPSDPSQQTAGSCGTAASPTATGTPCDDGACPGVHACDGAGHCGAADCAPADCGSGVFRTFRGKSYWFCSGPRTWDQAVASCRAQAGRSLVQIEDEAEELFVGAVLGSDSWIGANDRSADGEWRWAGAASDAGSRFWDGAANGASYYGAYTRWTSGNPGGGAGQACGAIIAAGGAWDDLSCSEARGFVCEVESGGGDLLQPGAKCLAEIYGGSCATDDEECVEEAPLFAGYDLTEPGRANAAEDVKMSLKACEDACASSATEQDCRDACAMIGGVAAPPAGPTTCADWDATYAVPTCGLSDEPGGIVMDPDPIDCTADEDCAIYGADKVCGFFKFLNPDVLRRVCGLPSQECPQVPDPDPMLNCEEPAGLICADPDRIQTTTDWADPDVLDEIPFDAEQHFGEPDEPPPEQPYAQNTQTPCTSGPCAYGGPSHPWCTYAPEQGLNAPNDVVGDPHATTGDKPLVSFDFDPQMKLQFDAGIGPLGLPRTMFVAEAGLSAGIHVSAQVVPVEGDFSIIDVLAALDGSQCEIKTARTHVTLLGQDFVPEGAVPDLDVAACKAAYKTFEEAADRANKALRDARMLLEQYYAAIDADDPLGNLCEQIAAPGTTPLGFPALAQGVSCAQESPAATIGRFIEYYRRTVTGFDEPAAPSLRKAAAALRALTSEALSEGVPLVSGLDHGSEELTIGSATFFVGPIPCDVEVYAALDYGVHVDATYRLDAGSFVEQALFSQGPTDAAEVGFIGVDGEPFANAFLGVFAGVGFDVGVAAAKFGVDARLTLGELNVPATAGAGLALAAIADPRETPADLIDPVVAALAPSQEPFLVPPKRYQARATYALKLAANVSDVLSGTVNARLKLKFLFFSKSWRKRLFKFDGFCEDGCGHMLFAQQGSLGAPGTVAWGAVQMPTPFPPLLTPNASAVGNATLDLSQAEELFYDRLCTCIATDDDTRPCYADADCCDHDSTEPGSKAFCFDDPSTPDTVKVCRRCRPDGESCTSVSECCADTNVSCDLLTPQSSYTTCNVGPD
jgi:hypothetical protein